MANKRWRRDGAGWEEGRGRRKDGGRKEEGRGQCNNLSETRHASDAAPRHGCLAVSG